MEIKANRKELIRFDQAKFIYEPFPLGVIPGIFAEPDYRELVATYPGREHFRSEEKLGRRYTFSATLNPRAYAAFFKRPGIWRELRRWVADPRFLATTIELLLANHIDLGIPPRGFSLRDRLWRIARGLKMGTSIPSRSRPPIQLVFAMLPAEGGSLVPHVDEPVKLLNLAIAMNPTGEWRPAFGGGTDLNRPKDPRRLFNRMNRRLDFDEVEVLDTVAYQANQGLMVVRTDSSWHSIRPMTAIASDRMRRTLNINLLGGA